MVDVTIPELLPIADALAGTEPFETVQDGESRRASANQILQRKASTGSDDGADLVVAAGVIYLKKVTSRGSLASIGHFAPIGAPNGPSKAKISSETPEIAAMRAAGICTECSGTGAAWGGMCSYCMGTGDLFFRDEPFIDRD